MDGDLGIVIEPESLPTDIYPYAKVEDEEEAIGVRGSCSTFTSRTDRSRDPNTGLLLVPATPFDLNTGLLLVPDRSRDLNTDRRELRGKLTFPEAEAMGGRLVMVGSQDAR